MIGVDDLIRQSPRKARTRDGQLFCWNDGDLWRVERGEFNDGVSLTFDDDVMWYYVEVVEDQYRPTHFERWVQ